MKRNDKLINIWLWSIPFMFVTGFTSFITYSQGFSWQGLIAYLIFGGLTALLWSAIIFYKQHHKHIAFYLFEYEKYNKDKMCYEKKYFYLTQSEYYWYFFMKHIKTTKDDIQKEIKKINKLLLNGEQHEIFVDTSFSSKQEMLKAIKEYIKYTYKSIKSEEVKNNKIKNLIQIDIIDFSEELKKLQNELL